MSNRVEKHKENVRTGAGRAHLVVSNGSSEDILVINKDSTVVTDEFGLRFKNWCGHLTVTDPVTGREKPIEENAVVELRFPNCDGDEVLVTIDRCAGFAEATTALLVRAKENDEDDTGDRTFSRCPTSRIA